MSPSIALLLCITFIATILILDKKHKVDTSWALWIPLLWLLIAGSRTIAQWLNPGIQVILPEDSSDGSPFDRIFFIFLIVSGVYTFLKRKLDWSLLFRNNVFVFLFFLYCGISIIWSDAPTATFNAWVKMVTVMMMAIIIITDNDPVEAIRTTIKRAYFVLIPLSILLIKYYPEYGRSYSRFTGQPFYGGVTIYKNGLGILCIVSGLFLVWDLIRMLRDASSKSGKMPIMINMVLLGMVIWLSSMAESATSLACFFIGVSILVGFEIPFIKSKAKYLNIVAVSAAFIALLTFFSFNALEDLVHSLGRDMTLTGRTFIWERVLSVDINPAIGTGYSSFWLGERGKSLLDLNNIPLTQAHNGYIEVYLNLGYIGIGLLIMLIINTYINTKNTLMDNFQYGKLLLTYMVVILITNITEASFATKEVLWFLFILISLQYKHQKESVTISDATA